MLQVPRYSSLEPISPTPGDHIDYDAATQQKERAVVMNDIFDVIASRRSCRTFADRPVPSELVKRVIEAGRLAPSGGNSQSSHLFVISNRDELDRLATIARDAFARMDVKPDTYKSLVASITASKRGTYVFHYNAPVLVVVANKRRYGNALADTGCLIENMMLEANALDLGSCWINQVHWLDADPQMHAEMLNLGLDDDEWVTGGMALGFAQTPDGLPNRSPLVHEGNRVTWVA